MQAIQTQGAYFHPYCFQDSSHRFCMGTLLFPRSRQCCRVWYQGIYSESLPPWWFSMFLWIFKACAPKAHSVDALWMLVVCSLLCAECPLSSHRFGKLFHRAQGRKQKLHFFFLKKSLNSPLKLVETEKTHGGYHNAIGEHVRDIAAGK